jgi:hypothetical protein
MFLNLLLMVYLLGTYRTPVNCRLSDGWDAEAFQTWRLGLRIGDDRAISMDLVTETGA